MEAKDITERYSALINEAYKRNKGVMPQEFIDQTIAELSFKAGYEQREKDPLDKEDRCDKCYKQGIREVVEWIGDNAKDMPTETIIEGTSLRIPEPPAKYILGKRWQSKLKEWEINETHDRTNQASY